jgi:hypothetical protein
MKSQLLAGMAVVSAALALPGSSLASTQSTHTTVRVTAKDFA